MKLVVGLGNPGSRYAGTRHNAGFRVAECFAARHAIALDSRSFGARFGRGRIPTPAGGSLDVGVLEPQEFMNRSGDAVALALSMLPVEDPSRDLLVTLDDIDLPFGRLRLRAGGGAAGHKGLEHLIERLGRSDLPRLRFGIGRPLHRSTSPPGCSSLFARAGAGPGRAGRQRGGRDRHLAPGRDGGGDEPLQPGRGSLRKSRRGRGVALDCEDGRTRPGGEPG